VAKGNMLCLGLRRCRRAHWSLLIITGLFYLDMESCSIKVIKFLTLLIFFPLHDL
jgi:hypothetical protein